MQVTLIVILISHPCLLMPVIFHLVHSFRNDMPPIRAVPAKCLFGVWIKRAVEESGLHLILETKIGVSMQSLFLYYPHEA